MASTEQNTYNPTDEMKRLLDIVKQQSTYTDIATHIQQLAGHSDIGTTQRYIDYNDKQLSNAVELMTI
jgi:hypothetical protein